MSIVLRGEVPVHYEARGTGPAIVFLHSFLCSSALFCHQVARLQGAYHTINIDLRGHGRSGAWAKGCTLDHLVDDVLAVLDAEKVASAILVGLSLGGFVAMRMALAQPERVQALVLMGTEAGPQSRSKRIQDLILQQVLRMFGPRVLIGALVSAMLGKTTRRTQPQLCKQYHNNFLHMDTGSMLRCIDAVTHRDSLLHRLNAVSCPTVVIVGDEDTALPLAKSELIKHAINGAELHVVSRAGHLSAVEQPEAVNRILVDFLQSSFPAHAIGLVEGAAT